LELQRYAASGLTIGIVPVDTPLKTFQVAFADGKYVALLEVVNQSPIYIDARLTTPQGLEEGWSEVEVPPRDNLAGEYMFETDEGIYKLVVTMWKHGTEEQEPSVWSQLNAKS
jgi:hypothetical protein